MSGFSFLPAISSDRFSLGTRAGIALSALLLAGALVGPVHAAETGKPEPETAHLAQKGGAQTQEQPEAQPFATLPGGNSGGLVYAELDDLQRLVAEIGSARIDRGTNGTEYISANTNGVNYAVDVFGCDPDCTDLTFTAYFTLDGITTDLMNEWNLTRRFGKAYMTEDGDAVLQFVINTRYGITVETFRDDLEWWQVVLEDYVEFIGF